MISPPGPGSAGPVRRITRELLADAVGPGRGQVLAAEDGVVAAISLLDAGACPDPAGAWRALRVDGDRVSAGDAIVEVTGSAWELAVAEDHAMGILGMAGGMAMRAIELRGAAPDGLRVVCGGWKKYPAALKPVLRAALDVAAIGHRLIDTEFVYVDKNVVTQLGGIPAAVARGLALGHGPVAVQVVDIDGARQAALAGAGIVMVDTGDIADLANVDTGLRDAGLRSGISLAFAGGVRGDQLSEVSAGGADIVDVGRTILDAPLWDLRFVVEPAPR